MDKFEVENFLKNLLIEILEVEEDVQQNILNVDSIEKWDSLNQIIIISEIESQLNIQFDSEKISELTSFDLLLSEILNCLRN